VTIPGDDIDRDLGEKLKAEYRGILAWCVSGCKTWQAEGLKAPAAVAKATAEYRSDSDSLAEFISERCKLGENEEVSKSGLYERFNEWAKSSGEYEISKRELGLRLKERGFSDRRTEKRWFWVGIGLISIETNDE
jgi:putative DNA primase/helicase